MSNFNVYVIHSSKTLSGLKSCLASCGETPKYLGIIYKSFRNQNFRDPNLRIQKNKKEETKKTIVFCQEKTIKDLQEKYPELKGNVADYNWESFPMPSAENGETQDLHISGIPNDLTTKDAEDFVVNSLACILNRQEGDGENKTTNFTVEFTPSSRETDLIKGFGKVHFMKHVPLDTIKLCKLILHNTPLQSKTDKEYKRMVTCMWHKDPQSFNYAERNETRLEPKRQYNRGRPLPVIEQLDVSVVGAEFLKPKRA